MGRYLDIARKIEKQKAKSLGSHVETRELVTLDPVKSGTLFADLLTETERQYYHDLLEIMQSKKFGMSQDAAKQEAGRIIARNRQPLQVKQAAQDYKKYGYCRIFSTVLNAVVYLARDQGAAKRVPDQDIPIFIESDFEAVKGLGKEEAKVLLEARILFVGPIKVENYTEPPKQKMDGKQLARSFYGKGNDGKL
ncbi:MAG: hypothetical protein IH886_04070 [Nitrospinae bacterium]|nr:hypothetical protein [Nitrospinota bacterium]